jgi:hypothetical protein
MPPRDLGLIPFSPAFFPFDASPGLPDPGEIAAYCGVLASMMECSLPDEIALVVARRAGPAGISAADAHIFRVLCRAVAGRRTAPWSFSVTGPDGVRKVS